MRRKRITGGSLAAAMTSALAVVACDGVHADLCEQAAYCGGGGELEIEACIAELDRREEIAEIYGCEDRWDDYLACLEDYGVCDEHGNLSGCDGPEDGYKHCIDAYERGKAKVEHEPAPGSLEPASFEPASAANDGAPKPKKCSVSHGAPGLDVPGAP